MSTKSLSLEIAKVVLIGESAVGKTSIISRFIHDTFDPNCQSSLGAAYVTKTLEFPDFSKKVKFDIWDTAGQEKYRSLAKVLYKDAKVIIFVYDITSRRTFDSIKEFWYNHIKDNIANPPVYALAANKADLYEQEEVEEEEGKKFADSINAIFKSTSAFSNIGIDTLFNYVGMKLIDKAFNFKDEEKQEEDDLDDEFTLDDRALRLRDEGGAGRSKCC